ncbi:MAG: hypothetical protein R3B45_08245 [Bdellovibrionota bacterium]
MVKILSILLLSIGLSILPVQATNAVAQSSDTEERFHDLFIIAGYSTAFGAALGAAVLGLTANPSSKLNYVYAGASIGFICGSIFGTYVVFSPMLVDSSVEVPSDAGLVFNMKASYPIVTVHPLIDLDKGSLYGIKANFNLMAF